jgi:hypothetical protein
MVGEHATFHAVVSSAAESVLGCSPSNTTCAVVVGKLAAMFQKVEGHHSKLERPATRICNLLLGPPPGRAWLADHLHEATGQLREELSVRREAEVESEALRSLVAQVHDLVLGNVDGLSLLATSMSTLAEWLVGRIDTATANGVRWGSHSALVGTVSHFPKLDADLEMLRSGLNAG